MSIIIPRLERLASLDFTRADELALKNLNATIQTFICAMVSWDSRGPGELFRMDPVRNSARQFIPPLTLLTEPLNQLCFGGLLRVENYAWECDLDVAWNTDAYTTDNGSAIRMSSTLFWGSGHFQQLPPDARMSTIIEILLHEQLHAFFESHICRGIDCGGTKEQQALCKFLTVRNYYLYAQFEYKGHVVHVGNEKRGHGSAFVSVAQKLNAVVGRLLWAHGRQLNMSHDYYGPCICTNLPRCLSHCYPDANREQILYTINIERNLLSSTKRRSIRANTSLCGFGPRGRQRT